MLKGMLRWPGAGDPFKELDEGFRANLDAFLSSQQTTLYLNYTPIGAEEARALAAALPCVPQLQALDLRSNWIGYCIGDQEPRVLAAVSPPDARPRQQLDRR